MLVKRLVVGAGVVMIIGIASFAAFNPLRAYFGTFTPSGAVEMLSGTTVIIDGKKAVVSGFDTCLSKSSADCIVIQPTTKKVHVTINGGASENWDVVRQVRNGIPTTVLARPNGQLIYSYK